LADLQCADGLLCLSGPTPGTAFEEVGAADGGVGGDAAAGPAGDDDDDGEEVAAAAEEQRAKLQAAAMADLGASGEASRHYRARPLTAAQLHRLPRFCTRPRPLGALCAAQHTTSAALPPAVGTAAAARGGATEALARSRADAGRWCEVGTHCLLDLEQRAQRYAAANALSGVGDAALDPTQQSDEAEADADAAAAAAAHGLVSEGQWWRHRAVRTGRCVGFDPARVASRLALSGFGAAARPGDPLGVRVPFALDGLYERQLQLVLRVKAVRLLGAAGVDVSNVTAGMGDGGSGGGGGGAAAPSATPAAGARAHRAPRRSWWRSRSRWRRRRGARRRSRRSTAATSWRRRGTTRTGRGGGCCASRRCGCWARRAWTSAT